MPPTRVARRPVRALGSLQLVTYANHPTKVVTELAYITNEHLNSPEGSTRAQDSIDLGAPLDVPFEEFMNGVNSRGRGTKTKQKNLTVEQVDAILLVMVQKGHVELIASQDDPLAIETIRVLPEAKKKLATFLPKLRGHGDIPYDLEYRGAIALAKRHFFPNGRAPTKRELMALLIQSYQERRELRSRLQAPVQRPATRTLSIQTSMAKIETGAPSDTGAANEMEEDQPVDIGPPDTPEAVDQPSSQGGGEPQNNDIEVDMEPNSVAPLADQSPNNDREMTAEPEREPAASFIPCTPAPMRVINPYMTPVSNPRYGDHAMTVLLDSSPTLSTSAAPTVVPDIESYTDTEIEEMLQATATSQGMLSYIWQKYLGKSEKVTVLETEKNEFKRKYERTKRRLNDTEQQLRQANTEKWKLAQWVQFAYFGQLNWVQERIGDLCGMVDSWQEPITTGSTEDTSEWIVHDAGM